jgi:hypothetical protein
MDPGLEREWDTSCFFVRISDFVVKLKTYHTLDSQDSIILVPPQDDIRWAFYLQSEKVNDELLAISNEDIPPNLLLPVTIETLI